RLDNVFWVRDTEDAAIFGQCFTAQPAMAQPLAVEPIESGLALPCARGNGDTSEDIYALAMLVLGCLIGQQPWSHMSDDQIISLKLHEGSLNSVIAHYSIPAQYMDFFRGALNDDAHERWDLSEVGNWLDGRMQQQRQVVIFRKSRRPLQILGEVVNTAPQLAHLLSRKWEEALEIMDGREIEDWITNELSGGAIQQRFGDWRTQMRQASSLDIALSQLLLVLHPDGPIRYKWLATTLHGISLFGTQYFDNPEALAMIRALDQNQLIDNYFDAQAHRMTRGQKRFMDEFRNMRGFLFSEEFGGGLHRFVYEMNFDAPCRSPRLQGTYIISIEHLLPALDKWAESQSSVYSFFDDSIMSYLLVHHPKLLGTLGKRIQVLRSQSGALSTMSHSTRLQITTTETQILAQIQTRENPGTLLKNICRFLAENLESSTNNYYSLSLRQHAVEELKQLAKRGKIQHIYDNINNIKRQNDDQRAFLRACELYAANTKNLNSLNLDIINRAKLAAVTGGQISSILVAVVSIIAASVIIVVRVF
ncbi:MAG: hypothetical protein AAF352_03015, partial [Pseudomonadota bacterium]